MPKMSYIAAHVFALELLKEAGFVLDHIAGQTETTYMRHPHTPQKLLRVSFHKNRAPIGLGGVASKLTFSRKDEHHSHANVRNKVLFAIGSYFLGQPRSPVYNGKKGTWETTNAKLHHQP